MIPQLPIIYITQGQALWRGQNAGCIPIEIDWQRDTADTGGALTINLQAAVQTGQFSSVQSIYIDNASCPYTVTVASRETQTNVVGAAGTQVLLPILTGGSPILIASVDPAAMTAPDRPITRLALLNVAMTPYTSDNAIVDAVTALEAVMRDVIGGGFVLKAGDTMTGPLFLSGDPSSALQASTKNYADAGDAETLAAAESYANAGDAARVAKSGDTMTGDLSISDAGNQWATLMLGADANGARQICSYVQGNPNGAITMTARNGQSAQLSSQGGASVLANPDGSVSVNGSPTVTGDAGVNGSVWAGQAVAGAGNFGLTASGSVRVLRFRADGWEQYWDNSSGLFVWAAPGVNLMWLDGAGNLYCRGQVYPGSSSLARLAAPEDGASPPQSYGDMISALHAEIAALTARVAALEGMP